MEFELEFPTNFSDCEGIDDIQEGVELSFRSMIIEGSPGEWIPLAFFTKQSDISLQPSIDLLSGLYTHTSSFILRGYRIPSVLQSQPKSWYNMSICGDGLLENPLQLRWLQTSYQEEESNTRTSSDVVILDNVTVRVRKGMDYALLLQDTFTNQEFIRYMSIQSDLVINSKSSYHSSSRWDLNSTYNVNLLNRNNHGGGCKSSDGGALLFNFQPPMSPLCFHDSVNYTISSRQLVSTSIDPSNITWSSLELITTLTSYTTLPDQEGAMNQMSLLESTILRIIKSEEYDQILNMVL